MVAMRGFVNSGEDIDSSEVTLFCTMEPCLMCLGAIVLSGIGKVVFAYEDIMGHSEDFLVLCVDDNVVGWPSALCSI